MSIGTIIKKIRIESGITQLQLSEKTGLSKSYISEIESGKKIPRAEHLQAISQVLKVPLSILYLQALNKEDLTKYDRELVIKELAGYLREVSKLFQISKDELLSKESKLDDSLIIKPF